MSEERAPYNAFDLGTTQPESALSDTPSLPANPSRKQLLPSPVPGPQRLSASRRRAEWALTMLESDEFQEMLHRLNERAMMDIRDTPMSDTDRLGELSVKLKVISEFGEELHAAIGEYQALAEIEEQQNRADYYGDLQTNPAENVI